ncbi:hypothetical protein TIFTF001_018801 [Ficus carica]|uniref:Uncharacterized protein n=1 Tax=Ficus carica TaxID=3494 RepID=A0AA88ANY7_FICCA|nr:hypothetical protein TIFTF001_018801 [Ficus carica]
MKLIGLQLSRSGDDECGGGVDVGDEEGEGESYGSSRGRGRIQEQRKRKRACRWRSLGYSGGRRWKLEVSGGEEVGGGGFGERKNGLSVWGARK